MNHFHVNLGYRKDVDLHGCLASIIAIFNDRLKMKIIHMLI